jgi:hypothetical protein
MLGLQNTVVGMLATRLSFPSILEFKITTFYDDKSPALSRRDVTTPYRLLQIPQV